MKLMAWFTRTLCHTWKFKVLYHFAHLSLDLRSTLVLVCRYVQSVLSVEIYLSVVSVAEEVGAKEANSPY